MGEFKDWLLNEAKLPKDYRVTVSPEKLADGITTAYIANIWLNYQFVGKTHIARWRKEEAREDGIKWAWEDFNSQGIGDTTSSHP